MNSTPSPEQAPHDVARCACPACQLFRYQRQYGPDPGRALPPPYPPPGYGAPGQGTPGQETPGQGPPNQSIPGYGTHPGYGTPPGYGAPPGYGPPPPGYVPPPPGYLPAHSAGSDRAVAALAHWTPLVVAVVFAFVIPGFSVFLCFVPPLIVMTTAKSEYVRSHAREALNFQLTVLIPGTVILLLSLAARGFGGVLSLVLFVCCLIVQIMAALKAGGGEQFRYPVCLRFVKQTNG
ncbi:MULTISPECIES: DUF4870 domain-containing protein [Streptomyces]|nr:DUF4870 domain-containing protein [Streptomyces kasugaensis]